jgi:methyltransferase (TIGR00027 family)
VALEDAQRSRMAASTAEGAASLRAGGAAEPDEAVRNPDHLAARFITPGLKLTALAKVPGLRRFVARVAERVIPGAYYYEIARVKYMDELLLGELERGISQLVVLGAGFDTRAYRFEDRLRGVRTYEVDHPVTARLKRERLVHIFGELPAHVEFVEIDFTTQELDERLAAHGYDPAEPTFFIWSGVVPYLTADAVDAVFAFIARQGSPLTSVVFDYVYREMLDGTRSYYGAEELKRRVEKTGEPLLFGIPEGEIEAFLAKRGLTLESHHPRAELAERFLKKSDGELLGRPYEFGGIAHARVAAAAA